jgi:hypothetical protein
MAAYIFWDFKTGDFFISIVEIKKSPKVARDFYADYHTTYDNTDEIIFLAVRP